MTASSASVGRAAEHKVRRELEAAGWWVIRAAGSKGKADLIAARHWMPVSVPHADALSFVYGVQVKRSGWPGPAERAEMATLYQFGIRPLCVRLVKDGRRMVTEWRDVRTDGTMGEPWRGCP